MAGKRIIQGLVIGITLLGIASAPFLAGKGRQVLAASTQQDLPVQDPLLQEGLTRLYGRQEPIQLPNGDTITGKALAEFMISNQIPVVWGSEDICGGGSCSIQYCRTDGHCSYENGEPGIDPIYINPSIRDQSVGKMARLTQELAHEAFHRMQFFGEEQDSLYEEYWAFYVGAQLVQVDWPNFNGVDPQNPTQLQNWFTAHGMMRYLCLPPYPGDDVPLPSTTEARQAWTEEQGE
jgi:hypothetical protein